MVEQKQTRYTPTSVYDNQPETGTERVSSKVQLNRHRNATKKKTKTRIPITFKGNMTEAGSVLRTKEEKYKESFYSLQENVLQCVFKKLQERSIPSSPHYETQRCGPIHQGTGTTHRTWKKRYFWNRYK